MEEGSIKLPCVSLEDEKLEAAIHRVYEQYGPDLRAFFRAVHKELMLKREESEHVLHSKASED